MRVILKERQLAASILRFSNWPYESPVTASLFPTVYQKMVVCYKWKTSVAVIVFILYKSERMDAFPAISFRRIVCLFSQRLFIFYKSTVLILHVKLSCLVTYTVAQIIKCVLVQQVEIDFHSHARFYINEPLTADTSYTFLLVSYLEISSGTYFSSLWSRLFFSYLV